METDRELLELAAKAAGLSVEWREWTTSRIAEFGCIKYTKHEGFRFGGQQWNPLTDDGDALRLAVDMNMSVYSFHPMSGATITTAGASDGYHGSAQHGSDPYAATRRAIVRAAAELGKGMK